MEGFDCTTAARAIAEYTEELSNWYVRLNRRRFWDGDRAALETLRFCLGETAKMLAPFRRSSPTRSTRTCSSARRPGSTASWRVDERAPGLDPPLRLPEVDEALIEEQLGKGMDAVRRTIELGRAAARRRR